MLIVDEKILSALAIKVCFFLYFENALKFETVDGFLIDLLLKIDFGVSTLMFDRKPVLTEKALPPFYDRIADAPSIILAKSSRVYFLECVTLK